MEEEPSQGCSRASKRANACANYLEGKSRKVHKLRNDVEHGLAEGGTSGPCTSCRPALEKLQPVFESFVRSDVELRHRKRVLPEPRKPDKAHYRNLVAQNEWIRSNLFDGLGNYRYCQACITAVYGIGSQRLAHQRSVKRQLGLIPSLPMTKSDVVSKKLEGRVVMPENQDNFKKWWPTLADTDVVNVSYPHEDHGLARKPSNSAKVTVHEQFLEFIDNNSQPNGRQASSYGALFYFLPKFTRIGEPKKSEKNYDKKVKQSLLCEFNRVQKESGQETCSERSAFRWLKEDRPKHAICPPRTDYCDRCKELKEEINRQTTILLRLRHAGNSSDVELRAHEKLQQEATDKLSEHKHIAQKALEHYRFTVDKCGKDWCAVNDLNTSAARLDQLQDSFELVLSADYQMTKLIPHWGYTDQPGISYYLRKVSHDLFGIVDHRIGTNYVSVFDKQVGPKNSDHTISTLHHYIRQSGLVPPWVKRVCIFLDNATSTNKNRYIVAWAMELVQQQELDYVCIAFLITSHTKFAPNRMFASIGSSYLDTVFNIDELVTVANNYSTAVNETGANIRHWRERLEEKYTELQGIRKFHDFVINRNTDGNAQLKVRERCDSGEFKPANLKVRREASATTLCIPETSSNYQQSKRPLSAEKMADMNTMYTRFIDPARWPTFISQDSLQPPQQSQAPQTEQTARSRGRKHCSTPGCDGTGHKNVKRWSEGHSTRAGCPIYHGVTRNQF